MKLYCIEVQFLMDSKNPPWSRLGDFEKSLFDFLKEHEVQAEKVEYPQDEKKLTLYVTPISKFVASVKPPEQASKILKRLQKPFTK